MAETQHFIVKQHLAEERVETLKVLLEDAEAAEEEIQQLQVEHQHKQKVSVMLEEVRQETHIAEQQVAAEQDRQVKMDQQMVQLEEIQDLEIQEIGMQDLAELELIYGDLGLLI
jgi:hypothetical protein